MDEATRIAISLTTWQKGNSWRRMPLPTMIRSASSSPSLDEPLRLVKYSKPSNNRVYVTDSHVLTEKWFDEQTEMVGKSIQSVVEAMALFEGQKHSS